MSELASFEIARTRAQALRGTAGQKEIDLVGIVCEAQIKILKGPLQFRRFGHGVISIERFEVGGIVEFWINIRNQFCKVLSRPHGMDRMAGCGDRVDENK